MARTSTRLAVTALLGFLCAGPAPAVEGAASLASSTVAIIRLSDGHVGAGVQIREGVILTAAHVIADDHEVTVKDDRGREQIGTVQARDPKVDVAVVAVANAAWMSVSPLSCETPRIGLPVKLVGHPMGKEFVTMGGHVLSGLRTVSQWPTLVLIDRRAFPGMSGGPVLSRNGDVVGMVVAATGRRGRFAGPAGAVPGSVICKSLPEAMTAALRTITAPEDGNSVGTVELAH